MEMERAGLIPKGTAMEDFMGMKPKDDEMDGLKGSTFMENVEFAQYLMSVLLLR